MSVLTPEMANKPIVNYRDEIKKFADSIGFHMSVSNGIFTLRPTCPRPNTFQSGQVEEFKRAHPEYANMTGTCKKNKGLKDYSPNYNMNLVNTGETVGGTLGTTLKRRAMTKFIEQAYDAIDRMQYKAFIRKLRSNHYRKLKVKPLQERYEVKQLVIQLHKAGFIDLTTEYIQLTEEGKKYADSIRNS
jgi:hypothetical protein